MLKRFAQVSLAVFLVLAVATMASAAPNVANTSQKGSMLVFPKVMKDDDASINTYFFIGNDWTQQTWVKCYWMDYEQNWEDFHFMLTANQPIVFDTNGTTPGTMKFPAFDDAKVGALVCWAQDDADIHPKRLNHLYGYAMIDSPNGLVYYNAYSFKFNGAAGEVNNTVITRLPLAADGRMPLDGGINYDACPNYLVTTFVPDGAIKGYDNVEFHPDLTLWTCKQDLRQDGSGNYTKAKFDIWNYNEVKYTGAYKCIKCFWEGYLIDLDSGWTGSISGHYGQEKFSDSNLGGFGVARLRVQGVASNQCEPDAEASPLLGLVLYDDEVRTLPDMVQPFAGHTMHHAGVDTNGYIAVDPSIPVEEGAGR